MTRRHLLSIFGALVAAPVLGADRDPLPACRNPRPLKFNSGPRYDPDHTCNKCGHTSARGRGNWIVRRDHGDRHEHQCEKCGEGFWHFNDGHVPAETAPTVQYTLPGASPGCVNGQCPTTTTRRIFRR